MEFVSSLSQIGLSVLFINIYGTTVGATIGYAAGHFIYLVCMMFIFRKIVFLRADSR